MRRRRNPLPPLHSLRPRKRRKKSRAGVPLRPPKAPMADPRFFDRAGPFSLEALATLSGARLENPSDGERLIRDVAPLESAGPEDVTFLDNRKYVDAFSRSGGGAAFIDQRLADRAPDGMALLLTAEPYKA